MPKVELSFFTATVFLAARVPKNGRYAIVGHDKYLGNWKVPQGNFDRIIEIQPGVYIFKGTIPVPNLSGSSFKFVEVAGETIYYEGSGKKDNRSDLILPDSWNFFIYKHHSDGYGQKIKNFFFGPDTEVTRKTIVKFIEIAYNRAVEDVMQNWR